VRITEILPVPKRVDWNEDGSRDGGDAWVEVFNPTSDPIDMSFWMLDAHGSDQVAYKLPLDTVIEPGGYLLFFSSDTGLDLTEGNLRLVKGTIILDEVVLQRQRADCSLSLSDGGEWRAKSLPTPGAANSTFAVRLPPGW
jgi:hypothetical protein